MENKEVIFSSRFLTDEFFENQRPVLTIHFYEGSDELGKIKYWITTVFKDYCESDKNIDGSKYVISPVPPDSQEFESFQEALLDNKIWNYGFPEKGFAFNETYRKEICKEFQRRKNEANLEELERIKGVENNWLGFCEKFD